MQSTGGSADTWVPAPVVMEEGTAPRCRCVMHRGGLAASGIASALPSPPLPLPWDPLQPSSSCSSHWHLLPSPGVAPSFGTPQAHCQCLLHLLSVSILCYTPTALPAEPTLGKEWAQFPNVLATFLVPFFSPCLFSCPDPPSPVPHFRALCCLLPPPTVPSPPLPPHLSFPFCPPLPHPRPHAGSMTSPSSKHQEMKGPGPSSSVAQGPMALVGGHPGPVGCQSIFAEHVPFLRKGRCPALQPTAAMLGQCCQASEGSGHNDFAEAMGRKRMSPTLTLCLPLSPTAPRGVTQNLLPSLSWPETWSEAGDTSRRSTEFYSVNACYGVTESSKGAKEALKEYMEKPEMRQRWGVALAGAVSQTEASYQLR